MFFDLSRIRGVPNALPALPRFGGRVRRDKSELFEGPKVQLDRSFDSSEAICDVPAGTRAILLQGAENRDANPVSECFNGSLHWLWVSWPHIFRHVSHLA